MQIEFLFQGFTHSMETSADMKLRRIINMTNEVFAGDILKLEYISPVQTFSRVCWWCREYGDRVSIDTSKGIIFGYWVSCYNCARGFIDDVYNEIARRNRQFIHRLSKKYFPAYIFIRDELPDAHVQIWMSLVCSSRKDPNLRERLQELIAQHEPVPCEHATHGQI